ncbi:adenosylcobinamide-GDP ribazoletransferase [Pseudoflavonifractor sp. MSJ-37]|uniref:adenosylcobinamide-GDP ribazoletransferase n=1 Tax=Pseudoflavonifractor sp. MSJ-37 TaxID=2841531 RepID=UPI001C0F7BEF|nr:adenosylcobinamide-GDP ribazoletransferase [Pseudoflavonifractor sp. MSJ-37]MBU5434282.1 adenosylcobinamide-GDP ribazoletransferase [Pseudoflavonifractor sp. MSJ-37]
MFHALVIAFSTYSRLPMPQVEWSRENMRYAICFFPLIGGAVGLISLAWGWLCGLLELSPLLRGAGLTVLPLLITGGIHMDGFCDTVDALSSHQSRERKLEILKDPHAGAFAIVSCGAWLVLYLGAASQLSSLRSLGVTGLGFVLSRALSGLALANWKGARPSGMLQAFADASHRAVVTGTMVLFALLAAAGMLWLSPVSGGAALLAAALCWGWYRHVSYRQFGGITGDLAGWSLQLCELAIALAAALTWRYV